MTKAPGSFLPYGRQCIEDDDIAAVEEVLRGDWLTTGPTVKAFEDKLCAITGAQYAVACANGTAALHLAALALSLTDGDDVVVPSMTFLATANAVRYVGAEVRFADVDPETGLLTAQSLEAAIEQTGPGKVRAVFPVHLNGQPVDMESVYESARKRGLDVVEDAAHALGSTYTTHDGEVIRVGSCRHSVMTTFSFHPVKTVAMGEGGAVTTNSAELYARLLRYRNHGMSLDADSFRNRDMAFDAEGQLNPWYYEMAEPGFNYRASDIHCALGFSQLGKLDRFVQRRRELVALYDQRIEAYGLGVSPPVRREGCDVAWHLYAARIDFAALGGSRAAVMRALREKGIGSQVHYIPVHRQPYYQERYSTPVLVGADAYYARELSLPLFPAMSDADVDRVVQSLDEILGQGLVAV